MKPLIYSCATRDRDCPAPETRRPRRWILLVAAAVVGAGLGVLALMMLRPHVYAGTVLQSSDPAPGMEGLTYAEGGAVDLEALRGDVVLVYFGYNHCPDLCPTTLSTAARAIEGLGPRGDSVTTMMVTVDPDRDKPELLADYVAHFAEDFRGVWGGEDQVRAVATQYGVTFEYEDPGADGSYLVGHTATLMAIDPAGALRLVYPAGVKAEDLKRDLEELLG